MTDTGAPHSESYIDAEGEERCVTCDKCLEPGHYDIDDHAADEGKRGSDG